MECSPRSPLLKTTIPQYHVLELQCQSKQRRIPLLAAAMLSALVALQILVAAKDTRSSAFVKPLQHSSIPILSGHPRSPSSKVVLHAVEAGELPKPIEGLSYYTSSQASDIIAHYSSNMDWQAWEQRMEDRAPPLVDSSTRAAGFDDDYEEFDEPAKFTVVGGPIFVLFLIIGTFLRLATPPKKKETTTAVNVPPPLPVVENGKVPALRFADISGLAEAKQQLQEVVTFLKKPLAVPYGAVLFGPSGKDGVELAMATAGEAGTPVFMVDLPSQSDKVASVASSVTASAPGLLILNISESLDMQSLAAVLTMMDRFEADGTAVALLAVTTRENAIPASLSKLFGLRINVLGKTDVQEQLARAMAASSQDSAGTAAEGKPEFWDKLGDVMWDFVIGSKEKKWNPDRRGGRKEVVRRETSSLSWGGYRPFVDDYSVEILEEMAEGIKQQADARMEMERQRAAIDQKMQGADAKDVLDARVYMEATIADVPDGLDRVLTGRQLAELCYQKYGFYHDMALLQFKPLGETMGRQIAFNIYGASLGSTNFSYSEDQYLEKLELVAQLLNRLDQAWYVRKFLKEPIRPRRGLPSTPRADTAVTLRLNTSPTWQYIKEATIKEYFP